MITWSEASKQLRMAQHAKMIKDPDRWPMPLLRVKSQPWAIQNNHMRFGRISSAQPTTVAIEGGGVESFRSVEQLVERWAVD
ncbi:hypothetical protein FHS85_002942 [Rhodoligotrophos appendicifer]|uniref:hypothetical protein n=1 Tax=Rhodoligotrophos appendicifer TaxID=987056 RepID=UPI001186BFE2|nr:hypothetical protein [Rhodoligotrophos appendicifer]